MEQSKLLEQLNRFTRRKHTAQEVYMFDVILCDNEVDRDGECFTKQALETLCRRFEGVTGIFDHDPKGSRQTARIFATELVEDPARRTAYGATYTYLKACAYMIRTDSNQDLIREIDGGIKKEVSVSCAAKTSRCSVCGSTGACAHEKGKVYGGRLCYRELEDISDVYEWSFVAVPAQVHAGVTKQYGASGGEDPVRKALQAQLDAQSHSSSERLPRTTHRWTLPSPAWPNAIICIPDSASSLCTNSMNSAVRLIGTTRSTGSCSENASTAFTRQP